MIDLFIFYFIFLLYLKAKVYKKELVVSLEKIVNVSFLAIVAIVSKRFKQTLLLLLCFNVNCLAFTQLR